LSNFTSRNAIWYGTFHGRVYLFCVYALQKWYTVKLTIIIVVPQLIKHHPKTPKNKIKIGKIVIGKKEK